MASATIPSAPRASCDALWAVNSCDAASGSCVDSDSFRPTVLQHGPAAPGATGAVFFCPPTALRMLSAPLQDCLRVIAERQRALTNLFLLAFLLHGRRKFKSP